MTVLTSIFLSFFIILLIFFTKTLHSPANLLICNTCLSTVFYVIITTMKISFFYMESILSDWWCRILAYLGYACLNMAVYSYVIQGLSRLFFIVLYRHRKFLNYKCHIIIIICQIFISLLTPLSTLITQDVVFRPLNICYIPANKLIHIGYFFVSSYLIPFFIVIIIYGIIYCRVIRSSTAIRQSSHLTKRDLELMRNILILLMFFLIGGIPSLLFNIILSKTRSVSTVFNMFSAVGASIATTGEKICLMFLNKEIREETEKLFDKLHRTHLSNQIEVHPFSSYNATNHKLSQSNISKFGNRMEDRRQTNE